MSKLLSRSILIAFMLTGALTASAQSQPVKPAPKAGQAIVVKLGHFTNGLHEAVMALKLAEGLQGKGARVTLFLNLEGVRLADKRQPVNLVWGAGHEPIDVQYDRFVKKGGKILVCPACAQAVGLTAADVRAGAKIADMEELVNMFLEAEKVIDY